MTIKVKPLTWCGSGSGSRFEETSCGAYQIFYAGSADKAILSYGAAKKTVGEYHSDILGQAAKAAAQADYEARILSAIEPVDPAAIRAEALREAAATCDGRAEEIKMEAAQICSGSVHRWSLEQRRFEVLLRRDAILSLIDKEQDQ